MESYIEELYNLEKTAIDFQRKFISEKHGSIKLNKLGNGVNYKLLVNQVVSVL